MKKNTWFKVSILVLAVSLSFLQATPTMDGMNGTHRTYSAKNLGHLRFSAGVTGNGSVGASRLKDSTFYRYMYRADPDSLANYETHYNTVVRVAGSDSLLANEDVKVTELVDLTAHLILALGITDYFDIGVALPIYYDNINAFDAEGNDDLQNVSGGGIGDLIITGKIGYPTYKSTSPWKMALLGSITVPTGVKDKGFLPKELYYIPKDSTVKTRFWSAELPSLTLVWANTVDFNKIKEELELQWHTNVGIRMTTSEVLDNSFLLSSSVEYWTNPIFGLFLEFSGETRMSKFESSYSLGNDPLYLTPGAMIRTGGWELTLGADIGLSKPGDETLILDVSEGPSKNDVLCPDCTGDGLYTAYSVNPTSRFGLSATISWTGFLVPQDADEDGIVDDEDQCPMDPEDMDAFEDNDGCPELDNDGDGITDLADQCPMNPEDMDGFQDEDGCPESDNDGDGIADSLDQCPNQPEDVNGFEDEDGCPDGTKDQDRDGISDAKDKCPTEAEDFDGFQDKDGCPDLDNDSDGIPDTKDKCAMKAEDFNGFQDEDGCPDGGIDRDQDGIPDALDKCPEDAEDKDSFQDEDGCPDPDNDGDGILDALDKCPIKAESFNGFEDEDGCPDKAPPPPKKIVLHGVIFETGSSDLDDDSFAKLNEVAMTLKDNPDVKIEISGFTDSRGSSQLNLRLSEERAMSVVRYLASQGVDKSQLSYKGYGSALPVASNRTAKGRAKNRRIEMNRLDK